MPVRKKDWGQHCHCTRSSVELGKKCQSSSLPRCRDRLFVLSYERSTFDDHAPTWLGMGWSLRKVVCFLWQPNPGCHRWKYSGCWCKVKQLALPESHKYRCVPRDESSHCQLRPASRWIDPVLHRSYWMGFDSDDSLAKSIRFSPHWIEPNFHSCSLLVSFWL